MGAVELLKELQTLGVEVTADGEEIVLRPGARVPAKMLGPLRQAKNEIMALLTQDPDYSITACICVRAIGPTGTTPCTVCDLPLLCPDCARCRGCKLVLRYGRSGR